MHPIAQEAVQYAYSHYLVNPYTAKTWYNRLGLATKLKTPLGVTYRPNHGLPHTVRTMHYLPYLREFYQKNAIRDAQGQLLLPFNQITDADILRMQLSMAFYVTGRESEDCFKNAPALYKKYRQSSAEYFEKYVREAKLIGEGQPFEDEEQMLLYRKMVELGFEGIMAFQKGGGREAERDTKEHVLNLLMANAHSLDIARCRNTKQFKTDTMKWYAAQYCENVFSRDLESLVLYAQNCLMATGDKVRAKFDVCNMTIETDEGPKSIIRPLAGELIPSSMNISLLDPTSFVWTVPYDRKKYYQCATSLETCLDAIESAAKPKFLSHSLEEYAPTAEEAIEVWKSRNAVMRLVEANTNYTGIRWDFEQIADPTEMRPVLWNKLQTISEKKRQHIRDPFDNYKAYKRPYYPDNSTPETGHVPHGVEYEDYYEADGTPKIFPIAPPQWRPHRKNTPYTRKSSWSYLPSHGRVKHYRYRHISNMLATWFGISYKIGILADYRQMHKKGDRYNFIGDVASTGDLNGFFWLGSQMSERQEKFNRSFNRVFYDARNHPMHFDELRDKLDECPSTPPQSELLIGASAPAIKAVFCTSASNSAFIRLQDAANRIKIDYGMKLPLLLVDGKGTVREVTAQEIDKAMSKWQKRFEHKYGIVRFFWKLFWNQLHQVYKRVKAVKQHKENVATVVQQAEQKVRIDDLAEQVGARLDCHIDSPSNRGSNHDLDSPHSTVSPTKLFRQKARQLPAVPTRHRRRLPRVPSCSRQKSVSPRG
ncbi:MAG: hypothetical protein CMF48_04065 [Legionellales bacterium]|nr:hypothetical protein [Legionellales bacterium]